MITIKLFGNVLARGSGIPSACASPLPGGRADLQPCYRTMTERTGGRGAGRCPSTCALLCVLPGVLAVAARVRVPEAAAPALLNTNPYPCPCETTELCRVVTTPPRPEVFGFGGTQAGPYWKLYDWDQVTAVGWLDRNTQEPEALMCHAHSKGARVFVKVDPPAVAAWGNATARREWLDAQSAEGSEPIQVDHALRMHADGANFDFEDALEPGSTEVSQYTQLVQETVTEFRRRIPGFQVSVDVAWSPAGIDGRWFDYVGLAEVVDLVFVMAYDMQSQIWGRCVAQANAPLEMVRYGLQQYLAAGVPAAKMVLGVPWYGYLYRCEGEDVAPDVEFCVLKSVPFRNVSCSDAAGREIELVKIRTEYLKNATTPLRWEPIQHANYFNLRGPDSHIYQMWFDDAKSLKLRYQLVNELGLRGAGAWTFDQLYPDLPKQEVEAMWSAFSIFTGRERNIPLEDSAAGSHAGATTKR